MVTEKIQELAQLQAKAAKLQAAIETQRTAELASLPSKYGYASLDEFIKALKAAVSSGGKRGRRGGKAKAAKAAKAPKKKAGGKRKRAKITAELKQQVKAAVEAGRTGAQIAKEFGISVPSVQNIKKELGLVKKRG
jgi:DNA-binding NarL/FixJ family response regulator